MAYSEIRAVARLHIENGGSTGESDRCTVLRLACLLFMRYEI